MHVFKERSEALARALAHEDGILIEPGEVFFMTTPAPRNYFRLGFASINLARIEPGIEKLATLVEDARPGASA